MKKFFLINIIKKNQINKNKFIEKSNKKLIKYKTAFI